MRLVVPVMNVELVIPRLFWHSARVEKHGAAIPAGKKPSSRIRRAFCFGISASSPVSNREVSAKVDCRNSAIEVDGWAGAPTRSVRVRFRLRP